MSGLLNMEVSVFSRVQFNGIQLELIRDLKQVSTLCRCPQFPRSGITGSTVLLICLLRTWLTSGGHNFKMRYLKMRS